MTWPSTFHLDPKRDRQNTMSSWRKWLKQKDLTLAEHLPSVLPWEAMFSRPLSGLRLCFLGHPHLTQLLATATSAFSPQPVPCPSAVWILLGLQNFCSPSGSFWAFTSLLFIYFYPQAYSMCTAVWTVMNFGFNSRMSKECFQLNKPNEVKKLHPFFTLFSLPISAGRMSKECIL